MGICNRSKVKSKGNHWVALHVNAENVTYFDSLGVEQVSKETKNPMGSKDIIICIHRIQAFDSIKSGYFWIESIDFILKGNSLPDYKNLFSPNNYDKNDKTMLIYFQWLKRWIKYIASFAASI